MTRTAIRILVAGALAYLAAAIYGNWALEQAYRDIQRRIKEFPPAL